MTSKSFRSLSFHQLQYSAKLPPHSKATPFASKAGLINKPMYHDLKLFSPWIN